ncbi:MAG: DUF979 domain-containing protein [Xanthomonadaceae bacterium]|jgi:uncharacterized membrane protein|nr:DUF979 domain-containing protein [Xanthomonadaceae bacterium]
MSALSPIYLLVGGVLALLALRTARDAGNPRRAAGALFWGVLAALFVAGDFMSPLLVGVLVVVLALLAGFGGVVRGTRVERDPIERADSAQRLGNRLFLPVLLIPAATVAGVYGAKFLQVDGKPLLSGQEATLLALSLGCLLALVAALRATRERPLVAIGAGAGLLDAIGWAALLPLVLAVLGGLFAAAGVGDAVAKLVSVVVPTDSRFACVLAYCLGMAAFTMIMGNAFAAFPVMTGGVGLPLLVGLHGAEPASMAAIGMLCGYCGTLMTPMAANFNIVPAALLELRDSHAVIKAQVPTALMLLAANVAIMHAVVFRHAG